MPKNRQTIPKEQRLDELLDAAEELFLEHGYRSTTMVDIAKAAGVTNATVYWYLPSKDDALAQVQQRSLRRALEAIEDSPERPQGDALDQLFTFLDSDHMRGTRKLHRYLHERAHHNDSANEVLTEIHEAIRTLMRRAIDSLGASVDDMELLLDTCTSILEGASAIEADRHGSEMVRFVIEHTTTSSPARRAPRRRTAS